jgi:hypothetical protein
VCRRSAQFALPDVLHTGRNYQLMECNPMSGALTYQLFQNVERYGSNLRSLHDITTLCWRMDQQANSEHSLWCRLESEFERIELGQKLDICKFFVLLIFMYTHFSSRKQPNVE